MDGQRYGSWCEIAAAFNVPVLVVVRAPEGLRRLSVDAHGGMSARVFSATSPSWFTYAWVDDNVDVAHGEPDAVRCDAGGEAHQDASHECNVEQVQP